MARCGGVALEEQGPGEGPEAAAVPEGNGWMKEKKQDHDNR